jgi:hypothetical protein
VKRRIVFAVLAFLITTAAVAQLPEGKWWRRPEVVERLALTDEQQSRLDAIFRGAASDLIDLRGETEKQSIALRGELDQTQLNRTAIKQIAARINEARARKFERELMMLVDMRAVLNEQQWNKMREFIERGERRRNEMGLGMDNRPRPDGNPRQRQPRPRPE